MVSLVIRNILSNAIKFTFEGGKIELYDSETEKHIILTIKDNGIGMDEETINRILNAGKYISKAGTNNEAGTVLGLLLCQDFLNMNNGKLVINSELEKGECFLNLSA